MGDRDDQAAAERRPVDPGDALDVDDPRSPEAAAAARRTGSLACAKAERAAASASTSPDSNSQPAPDARLRQGSTSGATTGVRCDSARTSAPEVPASSRVITAASQAPKI